MKKYKIKSYCKINLSLRILKKLSNGYHNIKSLITFCEIYDVISISKIKGSRDKISFSGKFNKQINKKNNTITKVLYLLRKGKFLKKQAFKIDVQKNIPPGSGLGGGSSNAANLLNFFNSKFNLKLKNKTKVKIARQIGFDTPISLVKKNTYLTGKKDEILRLKQKFKLNILLAYPNVFCSTKKIYKKNNKYTFTNLRPNFYRNRKSKEKLILFLRGESNDLEKTAIRLYPKIGELIEFIKSQKGCYFSRITGSGSACIGIFNNMKSAIFTKRLIKSKFPKYWCVTSKTI